MSVQVKHKRCGRSRGARGRVCGRRGQLRPPAGEFGTKDSDSDSELRSKSSSQMCVVAVSVFSPQNLVKFTFL